MTQHLVAERLRREASCELVFDQIRTAGGGLFKVSGGSMLPALWPGDLVTVERLSIDDLLPGQIVQFRQKENLIVHRVLRVTNGHLVARGDSLPCCDPPVAESNVVGRVVSIERNGRLVGLEQSLPQRIVAAVLRRSGRLRRITMILGSDEPLAQLRDLGKTWLPWAS